MSKKEISKSNKTKRGQLNDDYTLYSDGTVRHQYDQNAYPGGQNKDIIISGKELSLDIKQRILNDSGENQRSLAR